MNFYKLLITSLVMTFILVLSSCEEEGPMERAGEEIDDMADDVGDEMENAGNKIEDACEDLKEDMDADNTNC